MGSRKVKYGGTVEKIVQLITDLGPMSTCELCEELGVNRMYVSAVLSRMRRPTKTLPKRLYVIRYLYQMESAKNYPRAVFALGDKRDAPKPVFDRRASRKASDQRRRALNTMNSVFNLATPRREYRL